MTLVDEVRASLATPAPAHLLAGDLVEATTGELRPAAVLVAITRRAEPGLLLTVRREHLRTHAGQIAFPGGRIDAEDADATAAALREAHEEIGLPPAQVELWGVADPYRTVTGYCVTPVLGQVAPDLPLTPHEHEVADWFEAPLAFVLDPANQRAVEAEFQGQMRTYYQIDWRGRRIWGATAAMLVNLTRRLGWS
ncbi:CoA pyrophosphatase [Sphingomonas sp. BN140010]|uniref:CoA pyrophosphatase n=1 Tax=Sphingomonas arvum TaxID=2992113 RepID=A0ABT3JI10_9SPHN|nr:CoA pyrophosphatase [Sphingomonas sp. BN140010]MCW3798723.1 CoA pyrophosphatase [Sphingomonas sp. BN140010]